MKTCSIDYFLLFPKCTIFKDFKRWMESGQGEDSDGGGGGGGGSRNLHEGPA